MLDTVAAFLAANHITTGLLVLPVDTARDAGMALLAAHALLAAAAGLAFADLARALALPRAAILAAAILYELAAPATGLRGWSDGLALFAVPAFLAALERCLATARTLRLAAAISIVATVCTAAVTIAVLLFGALWLALRLREHVPVSRWRILRRVAVAALLALLLTFPLLLLDLPFRIAGARSGVLSLPIPSLPSFGPDRRADAPQLASLAPLVGLACLAVAPVAARRGRDLRLLLATAALAATAALFAGAGPAAVPAFLTALALLGAVALADLIRRQSIAVGRRVAVALVLLVAGGAAALAVPIPPWLAALDASAVLAILVCATPSRWPLASLASIATAATIAIAFAP